jgi:hypothetical protein
MGLATTYSVIDEFRIQHARIQNGHDGQYEQNYQTRLMNLKIRVLKRKKQLRKFQQIFNQIMSNK